MKRFALLALLAVAASAADRWTEYRSGPFRIVSNANDRAARERLNEMEQIRWVLGSWIGKDPGKSELQSVWPVTLVLFPNAKEYGPNAPGKPFLDSGAAVLSAWMAETPQPLDWKRELALRLIEDNAPRMPRDLEEGLATLVATLQVNATRLALGAPPPEELRTRAWVKLHYLVTEPELAGRFRVFLNNVQQSGEEAVAVRNAYNFPGGDLEKRVDGHLRAATFDSVPFPGKAISPARDFVERPVADAAVQPLLKQLKEKTFDLDSPRGLVAKNTRASLELAAAANPRWAEPHAKLAVLETNPLAKVKEWKTATSLEPRNSGYWQSLAEAQAAADQHTDAARSWASAERAAATEEARNKIRSTRREAEERRVEFELADRRRLMDERAQELERVKQAAAAEIHAAEEAANRAQGGLKSDAKPVEWWTDGKGVPVTGTLSRVDCLKTSLKLTIARPVGNVAVLVRDPNNIAVRGAAQATFACGAPRPAPKIVLEHNGKPDPAFGTAGDLLVVEFP